MGWVTLVSLFPRQATRVMGRLEGSDLELRVQVPEMRQATRESSSSTNRTVMAILVGAMVIALALLLPSLHLAELAVERGDVAHRDRFRLRLRCGVLADRLDSALAVQALR